MATNDDVYGTITARRTTVRAYAENVSDISISNDDIDAIIITSDARVSEATQKYDWADTDRQFPVIIQASDLFAAATVLDSLPNIDPAKIQAQRVEARDIIKTITKTDPDTPRFAMSSRGVDIKEHLISDADIALPYAYYG